MEPLGISAQNLYCQNLVHWATSRHWFVWVNLHSNFRGGLRKTHVFWNRVRNGPSRSSKVDFGTNRKRVCDFLLVINSNLGPILPRFRYIAGFLRKATKPLFHQNFRSIPLGQDCRCCRSEERRPYGNYSCNYFRTNPTYMPRIRQRHRRTDRRTDRWVDWRLTIAIPR